MWQVCNFFLFEALSKLCFREKRWWAIIGSAILFLTLQKACDQEQKPSTTYPFYLPPTRWILKNPCFCFWPRWKDKRPGVAKGCFLENVLKASKQQTFETSGRLFIFGRSRKQLRPLFSTVFWVTSVRSTEASQPWPSEDGSWRSTKRPLRVIRSWKPRTQMQGAGYLLLGRWEDTKLLFLGAPQGSKAIKDIRIWPSDVLWRDL